MAESINPKASINSFDYKLYFGKNISDPSTEVIELPPLHGRLNSYIKIGDIDYSIVLSGMKFTRRIYEPGTIEAEVTIKPASTSSAPTFDEVNQLFSMRQVEMVVVNTTGTTTDGETVYDNNETTIAKNYYVYQINPQLAPTTSGKMEMYVKLTINSFDKLMAIDKYCKAFTSKKLASEILKKEVANFGFKADMVNAKVENLHKLKYDTDKEMMQPYLVQYNESFYDFMVRTANRCGEFFYFEDGQLTLGLPSTTNIEKIESFTSVTMQGYTSGPINVDSFARDSAKLSDLEREKDVKYEEFLNAKEINSDESGIPKDSFLGKLQYNNPLATDEYIIPFKREYYNSVNRELCLQEGEALATSLLRITGEYCGITEGGKWGLLNAGVKLGSKMAAEAIKVKILNSQAQSKTDKKFEKSEHCDGETKVDFSSLKSSGWINNAFYADILKSEETQHNKIICIDMGTRYVPVKLGETIYVNNLTDKYIVVGINLIANMTWQHEYRKFDPTDHSTDLYANRQSQVIYAIPIRTETLKLEKKKEDEEDKYVTVEYIMPPVAPVPMIRKSGPLTAFVTDNDDKKYQGRVRIAFPWQSPLNEEKRKALYEAADSLKKSQNDLIQLQDKIKTINEWRKNKAILSENVDTFLDILKEVVEEVIILTPKKDSSKTDDKTDDKDKKQEYKYILTTDETKLEEAWKSLDEAINRYETKKKNNLKRIKELERLFPEEEKTQSKEEYYKWYDELEKLKAENEIIDGVLGVFSVQGSKTDLAEAYKKIKTQKEELDIEDENLKQKKQEVSNKVTAVKATVAEKEKAVAERAAKWGDELKGISSPWVRVATPMATQGGGAYFKPNVGDEVLVNFDSDNIERPYVVGSVFSKNHVTPGEGLDRFIKNFLQKKAEIALMSSNGHHITFTSPGDGWKFIQTFSPALKTLQTYVPEAKGEDVLTGDFKDTCGGIYMGDRFGLYEIAMSSHDRKIKINSPYGNVEIGAFSGITINAPNGDIKISGKNVSIEAGNKLELHSGTNITDDKGVADKVKELLGTVVDQLWDGTFGEFTKLVDLSIVRSMMEIWLRPIDGTLSLKSNNYIMLESGQGKVQVPYDRYATHYQKEYKMADAEGYIVYGKIAEYIKLINSSLTQFGEEYNKLKKEAYKKKDAYEKAVDIWTGDDKNEALKLSFKVDINNGAFMTSKTDGYFISRDCSLNDLFLKIKTAKIQKDNNLKYVNKSTNVAYSFFAAYKASVVPIADDYGLTVFNLHKKAASIKTLFGTTGDGLTQVVRNVNLAIAHEESHETSKWIDDIFKSSFSGDNNLLSGLYDAWKERYGQEGGDPSANFMSEADKSGEEDPYLKNSLLIKRELIAKFLFKIYGHVNNAIDGPLAAFMPEFKGKYFDLCFHEDNFITEENLKNKWADIAALQKHEQKSTTRKAAEAFGSWLIRKEYYAKQFKGITNSWYRTVWNDSNNGQILFSSDKGATYEIKDGSINKLDLVRNSNADMLRNLLKSIK